MSRTIFTLSQPPPHLFPSPQLETMPGLYIEGRGMLEKATKTEKISGFIPHCIL